MAINITHIKQVDSLVMSTKLNEIKWIKIATLKEHLRNTGKSLNSIPALHEYLLHLQKDKFIFDCADSYIAVFESSLLAFAKGKYSYAYRLDSSEIGYASLQWEKVKAPSNMILRLRNAIYIVASATSNDMCIDFLTTISSENPV